MIDLVRIVFVYYVDKIELKAARCVRGYYDELSE